MAKYIFQGAAFSAGATSAGSNKSLIKKIAGMNAAPKMLIQKEAVRFVFNTSDCSAIAKLMICRM
jgi:hypothetical protein